jgi:hypothetical protein
MNAIAEPASAKSFVENAEIYEVLRDIRNANY